MTLPADIVNAANEKSRRLRELLHAPEILILPGAFNVLSALLYQHLGFPAIQGSSAGFANALGYADLGIDRETTVQVTKLCASAVTIPVNADGEDGWGGPDEVRKSVRALVEAGAAGMNMEDRQRHGDSFITYRPKIAAFMEERRPWARVLGTPGDAFMRCGRPGAALKACEGGCPREGALTLSSFRGVGRRTSRLS
jgi:hypothetical protein